jgi:hypothetical protein
MKRIIEVESSLNAKIEEMIKEQAYRDFQHFVSVALENQVAWENEGVENVDPELSLDNPLRRSGSLVKKEHMVANFDLLALQNNKPVPRQLAPPDSPTKILWGQYYRFLPVKVGARLLFNMYTDHYPDIDDFFDRVRNVALSLRYHLVKLDRIHKKTFGDLLSASFPAYTEKSVRRFLNQYVVYIRTGDMRLLGMMPDLKLINVTSDNGDNVVRIGLTKHGAKFALLQNPILDMEKANSLSKDEIDFLLNHIADNLPEELEHMAVALKAIAEGKRTRKELNQILEQYYLRYHTDTGWSDTVINTMRAGLLSRLKDLALIRREKHGKNIDYYITDNGKKYMESVLLA